MGGSRTVTFQLQIVRALEKPVSDDSTISEVVVVINRVFERAAGVVRTPGIRRFVCEKHAKKLFLGGLPTFSRFLASYVSVALPICFFSELEICMQLSWHTKGGNYEVSELYLETGRFYRHISNPENTKTAKSVRDQILPLF